MSETSIETSTSISELAKALALVQAEIQTVSKGKKANIPGRDGKQGYEYAYADIADIVEEVSPITSKHGISVSQWPAQNGEQRVLVTFLIHTSGEWIRGEFDLPVRNDATAQVIGSALTYIRRYTYSAALGIVTDKDDDGKAATDSGGGHSSRGSSSSGTTRVSAPGGVSAKQQDFIGNLLKAIHVPPDETDPETGEVIRQHAVPFVNKMMEWEGTDQEIASMSRLTGGKEGTASAVIDMLTGLKAAAFDYEAGF